MREASLGKLGPLYWTGKACQGQILYDREKKFSTCALLYFFTSTLMLWTKKLECLPLISLSSQMYIGWLALALLAIKRVG